MSRIRSVTTATEAESVTLQGVAQAADTHRWAMPHRNQKIRAAARASAMTTTPCVDRTVNESSAEPMVAFVEWFRPEPLSDNVPAVLARQA